MFTLQCVWTTVLLFATPVWKIGPFFQDVVRRSRISAIARAMLAPGIKHSQMCTTKIAKWLHNVSTLVINGKLSPHTRIVLHETEFLGSGCKTRAFLAASCFAFSVVS